MAARLEVVPAAAGKRLGAAVLDWLPAFAVLAISFTVGFAGVTRTLSGGFIIYDTSTVVLLGGIGSALALVYALVLMGIEGRTGNTLGNQIMGIRSADKDGYAPGAGPVFVRGIITGAGIILGILAAIVLVALKAFDIALWIVAPLFLLGSAWAVIVVVSNTWDKNSNLRGWHDAAAKTLVFDIKVGRNPVTTGGIQGPYSFAPLDLPPVQQVPSPVAGAAPAAPQVINAQQLNLQGNQASEAPVPGGAALDPNKWQAPATPQPWPAQAAAQASLPVQLPAQAPVQLPAQAPVQLPAQVQPAPVHNPPAQAPAPLAQAPAPQHYSAAGHPDDDHDRTQLKGGAQLPAPLAVLRIRLDDGRDFELDRTVLIGRNPAAHSGEQVTQMLAIQDPGRSISKTHLHLLSDRDGIWVTDRNSTNGSAVTTPDGVRTPCRQASRHTSAQVPPSTSVTAPFT
ncbi:RDD family protein [Arthrobacter sp. SA17]